MQQRRSILAQGNLEERTLRNVMARILVVVSSRLRVSGTSKIYFFNKVINDSCQIYPDLYQQVLDDEMRGNYITVSARVNDAALASRFEESWNSSPQSGKYKQLTLNLPFAGRPKELDGDLFYVIADAFRSDHYRFWNYGEAGESGLPALLISDTSRCKTEEEQVNEERSMHPPYCCDKTNN